jgi:putative transposase
MARMARFVVPGIPHHVTQRGNGGARTFFEDDDYALYLDLLAGAAARAHTEVSCYCLMPNHVHIVLVPADENGLWRTFGELHRRYTGFINARRRQTGHLWQGRYGSVAMDTHLANAVRYVTLNPVRAKLVGRASDWPWSSAAAHLSGRDDGVVKVAPVLTRVGDFALFLDEAVEADATYAMLRRSEGTGRPIGAPGWLAGLEASTGRPLTPKPPGRRPRDSGSK